MNSNIVKLKNSRNRITPMLVAILIGLVWVLIFLIIYKVINYKNVKHIKDYNLDDSIVQEIYMKVSDDDIIYFSKKDYTKDNLPLELVFKNATRYITFDNLIIKNNAYLLSKDALDGCIKRTYGSDFKYEIEKLNGKYESNFKLDEKNLVFDLKLAKDNSSYSGTFTEKDNDIFVSRKLLKAYDDGLFNVKIGYMFYKKNDKYQICKDDTCKEIIKEVDSIDNYEYDKSLIVKFVKNADDIFYFESSKK